MYHRQRIYARSDDAWRLGCVADPTLWLAGGTCPFNRLITNLTWFPAFPLNRSTSYRPKARKPLHHTLTQAERLKETQLQLELILSEFGRAAMNTFTPLEIARGYAVAFPHMFDVIQIGGHLGARKSPLPQRLCKPTMASFAGLDRRHQPVPLILTCNPVVQITSKSFTLCIANASMQSNRIVTLRNCMTRAVTCAKQRGRSRRPQRFARLPPDSDLAAASRSQRVRPSFDEMLSVLSACVVAHRGCAASWIRRARTS